MDGQQHSLKSKSLRELYQPAEKKAAEYQPGHRYSPEHALQGRQEAAEKLLSLLGIGLAGGAGIRSLAGLKDLYSDTQVPAQPSSAIPQVLHLPRPQKEEQKKLANDAGWAEKIKNRIAEFAAKNHLIPTPHTTNVLANSWGIPAGIGAVGLGAYGGYKGTDYLLDKEREFSNETEVDQAQRDYENALAEQYQAAMQAKQAGDDLGIDDLYDFYEEHQGDQTKQAFLFTLMDAMGYDKLFDPAYAGKRRLLSYNQLQALKGGADAAALATALGTGLGTYNWTKGKNKQEVIRKALERRQQNRQRLSPPPMLTSVASKDEEKA